jgi:hypothetical protein
MLGEHATVSRVKHIAHRDVFGSERRVAVDLTDSITEFSHRTKPTTAPDPQFFGARNTERFPILVAEPPRGKNRITE